MLVDEFGGIVDLIVDNNIKILLGVVLGNILIGELLGHFCDWGDGKSRSETKALYRSEVLMTTALQLN
jgi:hypothetical protein